MTLAPKRTARTTNFTIVSTGWMLLLSGALSLFDLGAPVPWLPAAPAWTSYLYNGSLALLLAAMGFALARRRSWALAITFATSVLYSVDKLGFVLQTADQGPLDDLEDTAGELAPLVHELSRDAALLFLLFWWLFVLYLVWKRDYFQASS
jgi:hypothetical protein